MFTLARVAAVLSCLCLTVPAFAQTTVTLQQGLNGYPGTADTRLMNEDALEGGATSFAIINESSTSMAVRFAIFAAEGGPVPNGATIHSATLSLYKYDGPGSSFKASRFLKSWSESGAKWTATGTADNWGAAGAMSADVDYINAFEGQATVGASPAWLSIDVTAGVQAFAGGFPNNGWKVADNSGTNGGTPRYFRSRDHGTQGERPQLTITYTAGAPPSGCNSGALRPYDGSPVNGSPIAIAASGATAFEAEHFNCGGEGVAYHDNVAGNAGNAGFRTDGSVDISSSAAGNVVNNFENGEWLTYTINVAQPGVYDLAILAANNYAPGLFRIEIDNANVTGSVPVGMTGGWDNFQWFTRSGVNLPAGTHVLKLVTEQQYFNVNQIQVAFVAPPPAGCGSGALRPYDSAPVNGNPIPIPAAGATFEAEHFNCGGEGVAYHDNVAGNAGNAGLRTGENVDISNSAAGPVVNNFETGEWLTYTLNVAATGTYSIGLRASNNLSPATTASFRIEVGGQIVGHISVPNTGGWDAFQWFMLDNVPLNQGEQTLRLYAEQQYANVNQLEIVGGSTGGSTSLFHSFETSPTENGFYSIQSKDNDQGGGGRVSLVQNARAGSNAVKLTTFVGDDQVHGAGTWERTDISSSPDSVGGKSGMTWWWASSMFLPDDFHIPAPGQEGYELMDWHDDASQRDISVRTGQANVNFVVVNRDGQALMQVWAYGGDPSDPVGDEQRVTIDSPPQKNVWYDFVHYVHWAPDNTGVYRLWMRKGNEPTYRLVFERLNRPNMYTGCDVYLKLANYHGPYGTTSSVIHDRIVRGSSAGAVAIPGVPVEGAQ